MLRINTFPATSTKHGTTRVAVGNVNSISARPNTHESVPHFAEIFQMLASKNHRFKELLINIVLFHRDSERMNTPKMQGSLLVVELT